MRVLSRSSCRTTAVPGFSFASADFRLSTPSTGLPFNA